MLPPAPRAFHLPGLLSVLAALLAPCVKVYATPPAIAEGRKAFAMVGSDEGLASGAVVCMTQDRTGFLWMGSENGLMRYEGKGSRLYTVEDGLPSASIIRLEPDPGGGVWAATLRGLVRLRDGVFQGIQVGGRPYGQSAGLLAVDRQGRLWAYTFEGLVRQKADLDFEKMDWRPDGSTYAMAAGPATGSIYVASLHGITVFKEDGTREDWDTAMGLPAQGVMLVAEDGRGRVWAGTGATLLVLDPGERRFRDASSLLPAPISPNGKAHVDHDGSVWIPTQNGVFQMGGERLDAARGLPFRWVREIFRDREGSLWVMGAGLARLLGQGRVVSQGNPGDVTWYMLRDARGRMLASTDNGVFILDRGGSRPLPGTAGFRIKGMALGPDGVLWMVNTRGPTLWLRPGAAAAEVAPLGEWGTGANSVHTDKAGRVYVGHVLKGLLRYDPASRRLVQEVPPGGLGARAYGVYEMHEDGEGRLWAGADGGILIRARDGGWRFHREPSGYRVRSMALLPDGTAWVTGDEPKGLARVRPVEGGLQVLERRTRGSGLASDMVYAVRRDAAGAIWASTDKGVDRLEPPLHLGRHDGFVSEDCSVSALLAEKDVLWVGTSGGLTAVDTTSLPPPPPPPQAHILQAAYGRRRLEPPFGNLDPIPYDQASLDFRVAAPSYAANHELRFQVRLKGLEEAWRDVEGRQVHFASLPGRTYRFEVRAAHGDGPFGPPATLAFRVRRPWWRTGLAVAGYILGGAWLLSLGVRLRLRSLARSKAALEDLVEARTRELSLRNAELSEAFANVKQLSGLLPICSHCKKIRDDQGYWNQLESYLSQHAEVGFSHGICPECVTLHYPDVRRKG